MSIIRVVCTDQVLTFENTPVIASGGIEENFVQFSFCSQWDGFEKTAVFWRSEAEAYHNMLDDANSCQLPPEVTADDGIVYLGVFGVDENGRQRTSNVLTYRIVKGAITTDSKPSEPTPDIYNQLLAKYGEMIDIAEDTRAKEQAFEEAMTQQQSDFEAAMTQRQTEHEEAVEADQQAFEEAMTQDQADFEQEIKDMIAAGLLPDDSVATEKLKDSVVTTAKLADGAVTKEKLADGAVDAYTKAETLTDETKSLFGLDSSAVPDDVLGLFVKHWWRKKELLSVTPQVTTSVSTVYMTTGTTSTTSIIVQYSDSITVDGNGAPVLENPSSFEVSYDTYTAADVLAGKYWTSDVIDGVVYWTNADQTAYQYVASGTYSVRINAYKVTCSASYGEESYVYSDNRTAYPDAGTVNDFVYNYVGIPFDNIRTNPVKVASGSYVGTGTNGGSDPNSLTFDFEPKFVAIYGINNIAGVNGITLMVKDAHAVGFTSGSSYERGVFSSCEWGVDTVKWCGGNADIQANRLGSSYYYFAIG